jgi:nucleotide-binding universal stress UspA family protein
MKNILIATDLSPAARNATDYALRLAEALHAKVTLMSAYEQLPILAVDSLALLTTGDVEGIAQQKLQQEVDNLTREKPLLVDILVREGSSTPAVLEAAEEIGADLIIVGITGTAKDNRKTFGSTATGLARKTRIPLLIVPEKTRYEKPVSIALADDVFRNKDNGIPPYIQALAEGFQAKLYLIRIFNREAGEVIEILHQNANHSQTIGALTSLEEVPIHKTVAQSLEAFVEMHPISILALRPKEKSLPEQWINGSTTRDMIFGSIIPLLILPQTKIK